MAALTKNELVKINATLAAENAALRTELSTLRTQHEADKPKCTVHDYEDIVAARENCKRLAATPLNKRYSFTQVGIRVIARMR